MIINEDKNHKVFLIFLDFNNDESFQNLNNFKWRKFTDFYYFNHNCNVFLNVVNYRSKTIENDILHKNSNSHLNYKIMSILDNKNSSEIVNDFQKSIKDNNINICLWFLACSSA